MWPSVTLWINNTNVIKLKFRSELISLQLSLPRDNVCVQIPVAFSDLRHVDNTRTILNFLAEGQNTFLLTGWKFVILKCLLVFVSGCLRLLSLILSTPRARQGRVTAPLAHKISGEIEFYSKMRRNACLKMTCYLSGSVMSSSSGNLRLSVTIISSQEHSLSSLKVVSSKYFVLFYNPPRKSEA